jgi:chromosome segregation ATPase
MSSTGGNRGQYIAFPNGPRPVEASVFDQLEGLVGAARAMEAALSHERGRARKLEAELHDAHSLYDRLIRDEKARANENEAQVSKFRAALSTHEDHARQLQDKFRSLSAEFVKVRDELGQYRAAWAGVLQREREAKMVLADSARRTEKLDELEARSRELGEALNAEKERRGQAERHAAKYQAELQHALVRIHSAEAKFAELSKEIQVLTQSKRNVEEEIARIEKSMRERMRWEMAKERERLRAELEKEAALEREKFREEAREGLRAEFERRLDARMKEFQADVARFREESERARAEIDRAREEEAATVRAESERARQAEAEATRLQAELRRAGDEIDGERRRLEGLEKRVEDERRRGAELEAEVARLARAVQDKDHRLVEAHAQAHSLSQRAEKAEESGRQDATALGDRIKELEAELARERRAAAEAALEAERSLEEAVLEERRRVGEMLARLRARRRKGFFGLGARRPAGAGATVSREEYDRLRLEAESFEFAFTAEVDRARSLEEFILSERERFDDAVRLLETEVERLRSNYPLKDLLMAKELELKRIREQIAGMPAGPARDRSDEAAAVLVEQRERLRALVKESDRRIDGQVRRIRRALEIDTWLAEPAEAETRDAPGAPDEGLRPEVRH